MSDLKQLARLFGEGKITRREFLGRTSALGIAVTLSPLFLQLSARAAAPKRGGRLRIGMVGGHTTESLDPASFDDVFVQMTSMGFLRNPLVEIDTFGNAVPELAENWEA